MTKGIMVGTNTGLGDQIIMNGGVRYLAECYDKVWLVTWENRAKHAEYLYKDCPNIEIYVKPSLEHSRQASIRMKAAYREIVESHPEYEIDPYKRCFFCDQNDWAKLAKRFELPSNTIFPRIFYARLGVDYNKRYTNQKIPRDFQRESRLYDRLQLSDKPFVFVVNDSRSSKYSIKVKTDKLIINPLDYTWWKDTLIYDWQTVIQLADEVHMVNTSWFHLARTMQLQVPKFYYAARKVRFCEQNIEFLNDDYDSGWQLVSGSWRNKSKNNWWLN
jgi:hypothetical protein